MIIDGKTYSSVAIVDDQNYLVAVLSDSECICAGDFKVIAESKEGGLVFVPQENKMVKCFIKSGDGSSFGPNQMNTSEYVSMIKDDPNTKFEEEPSMRVTKGVTGNAEIFDMISKLPPQVVEAAIKSILGNTAAFKQNQKSAEKQASEQEKSPEEDKETSEKKDE